MQMAVRNEIRNGTSLAIRRPLLVRGIRLRRWRASLLFSSCSLAVAVCNLQVVGPRKVADHHQGLPCSGFLALPRRSKKQQAELQYYLVNNLIQEARLQYYLVNSSIQKSRKHNFFSELSSHAVNNTIQRGPNTSACFPSGPISHPSQPSPASPA